MIHPSVQLIIHWSVHPLNIWSILISMIGPLIRSEKPGWSSNPFFNSKLESSRAFITKIKIKDLSLANQIKNYYLIYVCEYLPWKHSDAHTLAQNSYNLLMHRIALLAFLVSLVEFYEGSAPRLRSCNCRPVWHEAHGKPRVGYLRYGQNWLFFALREHI